MPSITPKQKRLFVVFLASLALILLGFLFYAMMHRERARLEEEKKELVAMERSKMQEELSALQEEFEMQVQKVRSGTGYGEKNMHLATDSLLEQLGAAQAKVNRLTEELKAVKATDAQRINALSQEVTSLRKVLRSYVVQIDSLQRANMALREENQKMSDRIATSEAETRKLQGEKSTLSDQVARAARLEAHSLRVATLDKRGKQTGRIDKIRTISIDGIVGRNVTADPGRRMLYLRILNPNDQSVGGGARFTYEGSSLTATASKEIEYGGEDLPFTIYWNVTEALLLGTYRIELFSDGELLARTSFTIKD